MTYQTRMVPVPEPTLRSASGYLKWCADRAATDNERVSLGLIADQLRNAADAPAAAPEPAASDRPSLWNLVAILAVVGVLANVMFHLLRSSFAHLFGWGG